MPDGSDSETAQTNKSQSGQAGPSNDLDPQPHIEALKPFIDQFRRGFSGENSLFECAVRASLAKCFDYAMFTYSSALTVENAFYSTGTLRSVCEDLIILRSLNDWGAEDRNRIIKLELEFGVADQVKRQGAFFSRFRYVQPVLSGSIGQTQLQEKEAERSALWRRNGFPNENRDRPATAQIATKLGMGALNVLYDYIFRITSGTVHFNVHALLRTGWGDKPESGDMELTFAPSNMGLYEIDFCRIYGAILLTIYFEFFPELLTASVETLWLVKKLRRALTMMTRWPEMVTFEEMNLSRPRRLEVINPASRILLAYKFENGFIAGAEAG